MTTDVRVERTLLPAAFAIDFDFFQTKAAEGAPSLRVLCARVGFHSTVPLGILSVTHVPSGGAPLVAFEKWPPHELDFRRQLIPRRPPHPCAFCAQEWEPRASIEIRSEDGTSAWGHMGPNSVPPGGAPLLAFEKWPPHELDFRRQLIPRRVPHSCAFCAQEWEPRTSIEIRSEDGTSAWRHMWPSLVPPGGAPLLAFEKWHAARVQLPPSDAQLFSSQISCTTITDTQSAMRDNEPRLGQARGASVSPDEVETAPLKPVQTHFGKLFDN